MINDLKNRKSDYINIRRYASFADIKKEIDNALSFDNELTYDDFNLEVETYTDDYDNITTDINFYYMRKLTDDELKFQCEKEEKERLRQEKEKQKEKERKKKEKLLRKEEELKLYQKLKKKFEGQ